MDGKSLNITEEKLERLKDILPEAFSEGKIDWEKLRAALGENINFSNERYVLNWAGKSDAFRVLQTPTTKTLVPERKESINFDETENVFIEGENLEVLKALQKSYFGKIKMIYIDPPYNTGSDSFIYPDKFSESKEEYQKRIGEKDEEGYMTREGMFRKNSKENGQYHSNWLSMMYPRLYLARNLLRNDGVIFVSIDDNEVYNLRLLLNEIFGEENFIAEIVWEKGRKNDAKLFSIGHEYMLIYAKNLLFIKEKKTIWREAKPGAAEIWAKYLELKKSFGNDYSKIEKQLRDWYKSLPKKHPSKAYSRYKNVDQYGPWRDADISWPGGGGPRYDVIHPKTKQPCKVPERGWRFSTLDSMQKRIDLGLVVFRNTDAEPPISKSHLKPVFIGDEIEDLYDEEEMEIEEGDDSEIGLQVMPSVIYKQSQVAVKYMNKLLGEKIFNNPKDHEVLKRLIRYVSDEGIILDFFAGSCPIGEAVFESNIDDNSNRTFILVQLPEPCDVKSAAYKAGFRTIADIGKERLRKVIKLHKEIKNGELNFGDNIYDLGFKVFKLVESNFKQWRQAEITDSDQLEKNMKLFVDPVRTGSSADNMVYELLLKSGKDLNSKIEHINNYYLVNENELALLLEEANQSVIEEIISIKPQKVIALDKLFEGNDQLKTNTVLQMKDAGIEFKTV